jgi:hypothetical protein
MPNTNNRRILESLLMVIARIVVVFLASIAGRRVQRVADRRGKIPLDPKIQKS